MIRTLLSWGVICAVLGLFAWQLAEATKPVTGPMRFDDSGSTALIIAPHMREIGAQGVQLIAQSDRAEFNQNANLVTADKLHGLVIRDGRRTEVWAATGRYDMAATSATLTGGVRILNHDGYTFRTESAVYSHDKRLLAAEGPFHADGKGLKLQGAGLYFDIAADSFRIERNVDAVIERFSF